MKKTVLQLAQYKHLRSLVSLSLGALSLIVLLVAFQLNFKQSLLYTQVTRITSEGEQEFMIFREYRDLQIEQVEKLLSDCLQRNEIFGDGTGEICQIHQEQLDCLADSYSQEEALECL